MVLKIDTGELTPKDQRELGKEIGHWVYNGLDCCVPHEVLTKTEPLLDDQTRQIYDFERALQAPALRMMLRGVAVDETERTHLTYELIAQEQDLNRWFERMCVVTCDKAVNPRSHVQLKELFYETMGLPRQYTKNDKGERIVTTNREALEKLKTHYYALPLINAILKLRDLGKLVNVLKSGIDPDGRMRCSFNPAGTDTGRWSSSKNAFGGGTNFQNITERMRRIFVSDPGRKLAYPDLGQAESRAVAYYSGDRGYIDACESGDLHTTVARLLWPNLAWTGDLKRDRAIAEAPFYRHHSYRDMAKRGGHLTNYLGSPFQMVRALKIERLVAEEFQDVYFDRFPGIPHWHHEVADEIQTTGHLTTAMGRRRAFHGRLDDDGTLRKAVAYLPQSLVVELLNLGLLRIWSKFDNGSERVEVLGQVHDAILLQYWEEDENIIPLIAETMTIPCQIRGRTMVIPVDCNVGYSWNKKLMAPWGSDKAHKQIRPEAIDVLDWRVS